MSSFSEKAKSFQTY